MQTTRVSTKMREYVGKLYQSGVGPLLTVHFPQRSWLPRARQRGFEQDSRNFLESVNWIHFRWTVEHGVCLEPVWMQNSCKTAWSWENMVLMPPMQCDRCCCVGSNYFCHCCCPSAEMALDLSCRAGACDGMIGDWKTDGLVVSTTAIHKLQFSSNPINVWFHFKYDMSVQFNKLIMAAVNLAVNYLYDVAAATCNPWRNFATVELMEQYQSELSWRPLALDSSTTKPCSSNANNSYWRVSTSAHSLAEWDIDGRRWQRLPQLQLPQLASVVDSTPGFDFLPLTLSYLNGMHWKHIFDHWKQHFG